MKERSPLRSTRQRDAIQAALHRAARFLSAQELHQDLKRSGDRVGLTTVYRTLQSLATTGELDVLINTEGEATYRRCRSDEHHHHLVCRACGSSVEVASEEVERWAGETARRHEYSAVTHTAELYGLCRACTTNASS
jgi:Fur family transcriptional regulator, ferric uptake regulator